MSRSSSGILVVAAIFLALVALNFLFYIDSRDDEQETEINGSRSSYRATRYGTLAFYTLLDESGYPITRMERPFTELNEAEIGTLVVIAPPPQHSPTLEEFAGLIEWVNQGGLLVLIDREISIELGPETRLETFIASQSSEIRAVQPSIYTNGVGDIEVSSFASRLTLDSESGTTHFADSSGALLADAAVGAGRVVALTDPFIVSNTGIAKADNLVLALNLMADRPDGLIAFDEYHHGHGNQGLLGAASGGFMSYFKGTPVPWIMAQIALVSALAVYSRGRRFVRPTPLRVERRTTNLEFVSSMANVIRLARARDLAMENVYSEFRRKLCRYAFAPSRLPTPRLSAAVARRLQGNERELRLLLMRCEQVAQGTAASDSDLLKLVREIREIQSKMKL